MSYTIKNNVRLFIKKESTEGTYAAPSSGSDAIQCMDGLEVKPSRELLERQVLGTGLAKISPRTGLKSVSGIIPVYMRAGSTATTAPETDVMLESLMGSKRNSTSITSGTGHTTSVINVSSTTNLHIGDIVVIKQAGNYHASPISALTTNTSVTLLVPADSAPADNVVIEAFTTYVPVTTGHPSYSVSKYVESAILEQATGCKTTSLSLDSFETGKLASFKFGFEGLNFDRSLSAPAYTASFQTSETPVILDACIWQDGVEIQVNKFSLTIDNKMGFIQDTCDGKKASRITERTVKGSIDPYKSSSDVANFTKFNTNAPFSLFVTAHNPSATAGEFNQSVSFYLPKCTMTELGESDNAGVLQDSISFSANTPDGVNSEIYISIS